MGPDQIQVAPSAASLSRHDQVFGTWVGITPKRLFLLLIGYFAAQALLRGLVSEVAGIDDVDQILRAQIWSWGYGPQPPLYTWLTKIFLSVFGYNTFSLAL